jgi:hypothetical protein
VPTAAEHPNPEEQPTIIGEEKVKKDKEQNHVFFSFPFFRPRGTRLFSGSDTIKWYGDHQGSVCQERHAEKTQGVLSL